MIMTRVFTVSIAAILIATFTATFAPGAAWAEPPAKAPADKKAEPAPAKAKETIPQADADKFLAFFEKLVAIIVADKDDCAKMATDVNAYMDANQAIIQEANDAKNQNKELPPAAKEKLDKLVKTELGPSLKKCGKDKAVQAALERMGKKRK